MYHNGCNCPSCKNCNCSQCRDVGMADKEDLKSSEIKSHPGSSPGPGTNWYGVDWAKGESPREKRIDLLKQQQSVLLDYLQMKFDERDFHAVQDAASDLRDIDAELKGLRFNNDK